MVSDIALAVKFCENEDAGRTMFCNLSFHITKVTCVRKDVLWKIKCYILCIN